MSRELGPNTFQKDGPLGHHGKGRGDIWGACEDRHVQGNQYFESVKDTGRGPEPNILSMNVIYVTVRLCWEGLQSLPFLVHR